MTNIWWIEDFLSGKVIDNRYYSTREEAEARREVIGYGLIKSLKVFP
jgi:hypothetical protein